AAARARSPRMRVFDLLVPAKPTPVLVEVPHAGLAVPESVRPLGAVPPGAVQRQADIYMHAKCHDVPEARASLLADPVALYIAALNRSPDDVDARTVRDHPSPRKYQPRGVVWRMTTDGRPTLPRPLRHAELVDRLSVFHTPYHAALRAQLEALRAQHGHA